MYVPVKLCTSDARRVQPSSDFQTVTIPFAARKIIEALIAYLPGDALDDLDHVTVSANQEVSFVFGSIQQCRLARGLLGILTCWQDGEKM